MPLQIVPLEKADTTRWASFYYPAFKDSNVACLWTGEPTPENTVIFGNFLGKNLDKENYTTLKCIDTDLPEGEQMIGVATWVINDKERSIEEVKAGHVFVQRLPEERPDARIHFLQGVWDCTLKVIGGRPHVYLATLIIDPKHQRRGAGKMLLDWGMRKQDELGLPGYLESSMFGRRLYTSNGYVPQMTAEFDGREWGAPGVDVHTAMIREPQPLN